MISYDISKKKSYQISFIFYYCFRISYFFENKFPYELRLFAYYYFTYEVVRRLLEVIVYSNYSIRFKRIELSEE